MFHMSVSWGFRTAVVKRWNCRNRVLLQAPLPSASGLIQAKCRQHGQDGYLSNQEAGNLYWYQLTIRNWGPCFSVILPFQFPTRTSAWQMALYQFLTEKYIICSVLCIRSLDCGR